MRGPGRSARRPSALSHGALLLGLMGLGGVVSGMQARARTLNRLDPVTMAGQGLLAPVAILGGVVHDGLAGAGAGLLYGAALRDENARLRALANAARLYDDRVALLDAELRERAEGRTAVRAVGRAPLTARIVGYAAAEGRVTLDQGTANGVRPGLAIVSGGGLLGTVQTAARNRATGLYVASPNLRLGVMDVSRRPPALGLLQGGGAGEAVATFYDVRTPVEVGDRVVTSGFGELVPRGLLVGRVVAVETDDRYGVVRALVLPEASLGASRTVEVVR